MHGLTDHLLAAAEKMNHNVIGNSVKLYVWQPLCVFDQWSTWIFSGGRDGRDEDTASRPASSAPSNQATNGSQKSDKGSDASSSYSYSFCTEDGNEYGAMTTSEDLDSVDSVDSPAPLQREQTSRPDDALVQAAISGATADTSSSLVGGSDLAIQQPATTEQTANTAATTTNNDEDATPAGIPVVRFREALESIEGTEELKAVRFAEAEERQHDLSHTARSTVPTSTDDTAELHTEVSLGNTLHSVASFAHSGDTRQAAREAIRAINLKNIRTITTGKVRALGSEQWATLITVPDVVEWLSAGNGLFSFACRPGDKLHPDAKEAVAAVVNLSSFSDEVRENNAPPVHMENASEIEKLKFIVVKATYALPGVDCRKLTPEVLSSTVYQENCQPGKPKIETKMALPPNTFRLTKTIISWVLSVVIQLKVSHITDKATLRQLSCVDGIVPSHAILMERTKRDVSKNDSTMKVKSLLLYYRVAPASCIVTNFSVVVNTSLPSAAATIVNTFGSKGAEEVRETMVNTRKYLINTYGDARPRRRSFRRLRSAGSLKDQTGLHSEGSADSGVQG